MPESLSQILVKTVGREQKPSGLLPPTQCRCNSMLLEDISRALRGDGGRDTAAWQLAGTLYESYKIVAWMWDMQGKWRISAVRKGIMEA